MRLIARHYFFLTTFGFLTLIFAENSFFACKDELNKAQQERNAIKAIELYRQILSVGLKDSCVAEALLRCGQFYYTQGEYFSTIHIADSLIEFFPATRFAKEGVFLKEAASFSLGQKVDSTGMIISGKESINLKPKTVPGSTESFTIQLGVFQDRANASRLQKKYKPNYNTVELVEMHKEDKLLFAVRLGCFKSLKEAEDFALLEMNLSKKDFRIVKL